MRDESWTDATEPFQKTAPVGTRGAKRTSGYTHALNDTACVDIDECAVNYGHCWLAAQILLVVAKVAPAHTDL